MDFNNESLLVVCVIVMEGAPVLLFGCVRTSQSKLARAGKQSHLASSIQEKSLFQLCLIVTVRAVSFPTNL
jgi:hypothetical protein